MLTFNDGTLQLPSHFSTTPTSTRQFRALSPPEGWQGDKRLDLAPGSSHRWPPTARALFQDIFLQLHLVSPLFDFLIFFYMCECFSKWFFKSGNVKRMNVESFLRIWWSAHRDRYIHSQHTAVGESQGCCLHQRTLPSMILLNCMWAADPQSVPSPSWSLHPPSRITAPTWLFSGNPSLMAFTAAYLCASFQVSLDTNTHTYTHVCIYIYIYISGCTYLSIICSQLDSCVTFCTNHETAVPSFDLITNQQNKAVLHLLTTSALSTDWTTIVDHAESM